MSEYLFYVWGVVGVDVFGSEIDMDFRFRGRGR